MRGETDNLIYDPHGLQEDVPPELLCADLVDPVSSSSMQLSGKAVMLEFGHNWFLQSYSKAK